MKIVVEFEFTGHSCLRILGFKNINFVYSHYVQILVPTFQGCQIFMVII